ncbi:cyclic peptide export ABC transporter [Burkholderia gladioli]|uniref:cyclic peptide export ABC transporter n=1 Tax=Burkholderia gladioli TaxID=28095 RepID=UPI0007C6B4E9|nr:cyclic peptide export ABC transporter [Burkholderia gladioli]MDA0573815.1 cyclic peptide export ABC transporter [Burkholderia gladioli]MDA0602154.1 cyclic peptide export ABC transporter [Burkholderia gladioli]
MNILRYLYRQSPRGFAVATLASLAGGLASTGMVAAVSGSVTTDGRRLALHGLAFLALCALSLAARSWSEIVVLDVAQSITQRLRLSLSRKLLATPLEKLQRLGKSDLLVILTHDIDTFSQASRLLPAILGDAVIIAACLGYLAWQSWPVFAIMVLSIAVGLAGYRFAERAPLARLREVRELTDVVYRHFRSLIEGTKELQLSASRARQFVDKLLAPDLQGYRALSFRGARDYIWVSNAGSLLFYLVIGLIAFGGPFWLDLPIEVRATTIMIGLYLVGPITGVVNALPMARQADIALHKMLWLADSLGDAPAASSAAGTPFASQAPLRLVLRGVSHEFVAPGGDAPFRLGPLDLSVEHGEVLYIIGGNGSGKTTLAMLLLGLYAPTSGSIELNGVAVDASNLEAYRAHFAAVFADFHLFEHLLAGEGREFDPRANRYLERLGMGAKVRIENGRFSTIDLSTGQRKRLALVSAYLEDRPIYLFDEWAADQDPEFKHVFYTELLPELKARGKTVIVITHDDGYFAHADRTVKLRDGMRAGAGAESGRAAASTDPGAVPREGRRHGVGKDSLAH